MTRSRRHGLACLVWLSLAIALAVLLFAGCAQIPVARTYSASLGDDSGREVKVAIRLEPEGGLAK